MTKIEKLVTSLEVSKKLKDLGIVQESAFYWCAVNAGTCIAWEIREASSIQSNHENISAFTVQELWEMMGKNHICYLDVEREGEWISENIGTKFSYMENTIEITIEYLNNNLKDWQDETD